VRLLRYAESDGCLVDDGLAIGLTAAQTARGDDIRRRVTATIDRLIALKQRGQSRVGGFTAVARQRPDPPPGFGFRP
jgi:hypothetical protein